MEALSLAANIISVVHVTSEIIDRLNDFKNTVDGIPRTLQAISNELPTLKLTLKKVAEAIEDGRVTEDSEEALRPLLADFEEQIRAIGDIVDKMRSKDPSRIARNFKAVTSFRYDDQIKYHESVIRGYASTLSLERVVSGPGKDLAALRPPLVPTFVCPYGQDLDFIERPLLADILSQRRPGSRHALVGGAGMGKSQLAISYGYRIQEAFPDTWVFWIDAESVTKFEQGYYEIANMVRIMGRNDKDADILNLVYEWLRNKHNGNWVMILDNADDKEVFTSYPSAHRQASLGKQIRDFLPQSSNGSLLVTSRSRDAAYHVTCNYKYILTVEPMTESEAMALMQSQFEEVHPESEIKLLAETLGFVPLAISQAAANISRRSLPISSYLDELRKGNESSASLLDESSPQLRRDSGRSNSIVATWKVTFEYVRKAAPSAARLLSLMCFFDRQNIPEALLEGQYGEEVNITSQECQKVWWRQRLRMKRKKTDSLPSKSLPCDFEQDWLILRDFSLIKLHRNRRNFSMHPMVQFTTLRWLVLRRECDAWSQHFTSIMNDNFFDPGLAASKDCEQLIAHAIAAIPYRPADEATRSLQIWAELTYKVASYYEIKIGAFDRAQKLFCSAAEAFEITLGSCASQSLNCNIRLSSMLWVLGRHGDAEKLYRRTLRLQQIFLGLDHPSTLETLDRIGEALVAQGKHTEAETMHVRSLEARLRTLGPVHDDTQRALSARGLYLSNQNRYGEAYDVWRMAYEARVQDDTTMFDEGWVHHLSGMGLGLMLLGKPREAEKYFREAITEHEKKSTPNNEFVASFVRLARALASQDNYAGAEPFFRRAVECHDMQAADDYNLEQLNTMSDFAYCLWKLGRLDQAEIIASRCLAERIENCGMQDRNTFASMWTLASILEKQRRYAEALKLFKVAFEATKELLGDQHGDTTAFRRDYVALREKCGDDTLATGRGSCGNVCELEGDVALTEVGRDPTENDIQSGYQDTGAGAEQDAVKLPDDDQSTSEDTNRVRAVSGTSSLPAAFGKESFVASGEQNKIPILVRPDVVVR